VQSVALYRRALEEGQTAPGVVYDFGTALLAADSEPQAIEALERVIEVPDSEVRYRALFNLGLAHLRRGIALGDEGGKDDLDAALAAYRRALLLRNDELDAKWNYELALRRKQQSSGGGGGGGGSSGNPSPAPQAQGPQPSGGLGMNQAEQLLASAAREERDVQAKRQRQTRVEPPPGGKDW
jgi:Ca-activated chloride channel family protein